MKLNYYADTDSLYIDLSSKTSVTSEEISEGIVFDFDKDSNIVGLDIDQASLKLDMNELVLSKLPVSLQKITVE
ncbi:MAG: DUF2283 domain-containing protein [Ignavibacteria bacterium]|jgi:uncharacterized protein YuzE|nr:DUF2283 domain-containing protein [Ignavibacteria bacterium]